MRRSVQRLLDGLKKTLPEISKTRKPIIRQNPSEGFRLNLLGETILISGESSGNPDFDILTVKVCDEENKIIEEKNQANAIAEEESNKINR